MTAPSDAENTPVRRSIFRNLSNTGYSQNDDEAERAQRRRTFGKTPTNTTLSSDSLVEEQQNFQNCLKIFHDNKICQKNAWQLTLIDNLANLLNSHHKTLKNFQIVGSSLEATTKIYGLRVDSVHSDIMRMSSGLGRMKHDAPKSNDNEDDDGGQRDNTIDDENGQTKAPAKKKRLRKQVNTVTTNKSTLNARLDIIQMPDCLNFQLNSIMGETSSSNKLLLNLLQTKQSDLKLTMEDKFWDDRKCDPIDLKLNNDYDSNDDDYVQLPIRLNTETRLTLRQQMKGYVISNTPMDDEDDEEQPQVAHASFNMSQCLEYAFDIDAEVEPIPSGNDHYTMDVMDFDGGNDFDDLTQEDLVAISACKSLRRKTTIIEDLRPSDNSKLEYSYRPLDNISQFWAGPSYWKFRKSRKLTMNRESMATSEGSTVAPTAHANRRRVNRLKVEPIKFTTLVGSQLDGKADSDDDFISIDSKQGLKFKKNNVYKRWDSKKLKIPTDLHIDRDLFSHYTFCPSFPIWKKTVETPITDIEAEDGYDFDQGDDEALFGTDPQHDDNVSMPHLDGISMDHAGDNDMGIPHMDQLPHSQNNQTELEISMNYEGAPELVQKIDIQFAKRAKVIDMKQMKTVCLNTITKQCEKTSGRVITNIPNIRDDEDYKEGVASFGIIYNNLPHLLTKTMAENLSPSIAFYSILHLANEHRLRLYKSNRDHDMNVFLIRQLEE